MKKNREKIIELIDKLLNGEGTESEQDEWIDIISKSVPFYEKIINLIFWSDEEINSREIYERAELEHKPIHL
ncbi:MAG: hypothetical protein AB9856_06445 [Cellulosilyticaceae bacterium]